MHQFDALSADVGSATPKQLKCTILGVDAYFTPINAQLKRVRDAPQNKEAASFRSKTLRCLYD